MKSLLIEDTVAMTQLLTQLEQEPVLAVDTEFFRETTYYPNLGLVQIASDSIIACIDPIAFDAAPALKKLFTNPDIIKVFHSCSQDLEVLYHSYGVLPSPIHDTQIAEALLSESEQIGYARLVEAELGVTLAKTQTRTNWLKRPLSDAQIQYAGDDVSYLYTLYHSMINRLDEAQRTDWFAQDCAALTLPYQQSNTTETNLSNAWTHVKGSKKLAGITLAIIQAIASWREQIAIDTDTTRRRVLADDIILQQAMEPPQTRADMSSLKRNRFSFNNKQIDTLFNRIKAAKNSDASQWPVSEFQLLSNEQKAQLKTLQQCLNNKARELGISPSVLCSRKDLEKLLKGERHLAVLNGWRKTCIGDTLLENLQD